MQFYLKNGVYWKMEEHIHENRIYGNSGFLCPGAFSAYFSGA